MSDEEAGGRCGCLPAILPCLALIVVAAHAHAQEVRDFNTDTPGKGYTPYTVAPGYFQIESDSFHITEQGNTQVIETLDPAFKYGLTSNIEVDLQINGFLNMQTTVDGRTVSLSGFGDTVPSVKWNVIGNDRGAFSGAVKAGFKIPTASAGLGTGAVEYFVALPAQVSLPGNFSLGGQAEIDLLKNQADTGHSFNYSEIVSVGRQFGKATLSVEGFADSATDPNVHAYYTADLGVSYAVTPVILVAFGTYFGLNRFAPRIEAYSSFGFRF